MTNRIQRAVNVLLLTVLIGGSLAAPALAGHRGDRGDRRGGSPRYEQRRGGDWDRGRGWERGRERREWRGHRGHSDLVPFLGGVVLGTVIGSHCDAPPPPCRVRSVVFVYDCDWCDFRTRGYDDFCSHMVCEHRIPRCDVGRWFQPNEHGSWEDDY